MKSIRISFGQYEIYVCCMYLCRFVCSCRLNELMEFIDALLIAEQWNRRRSEWTNKMSLNASFLIDL